MCIQRNPPFEPYGHLAARPCSSNYWTVSASRLLAGGLSDAPSDILCAHPVLQFRKCALFSSPLVMTSGIRTLRRQRRRSRVAITQSTVMHGQPKTAHHIHGDVTSG